jgi:hypothetical protein
MAMHETQPDTLPAPLVSAFTSGWGNGINFLSQCQLGHGFTSNFAEFHAEPLFVISIFIF